MLQQEQCHILLCWCRVSVKHGAGLALLGGLSPLANDMCGHCDPLGHKENKSLWDFREPFQNWVWKKVTRSTSHLPCTWLKLDDCVIGPIGSSVSWTWGQNTSRWKDEREEGKIFEYQYSKFTCVPTTNAKIYHNSHCQSFRFTVWKCRSGLFLFLVDLQRLTLQSCHRDPRTNELFKLKIFSQRFRKPGRSKSNGASLQHLRFPWESLLSNPLQSRTITLLSPTFLDPWVPGIATRRTQTLAPSIPVQRSLHVGICGNQKADGKKIILCKTSSHAKNILLALFRFLLCMCF